MADVANLKIQVKSSGVKQATNDLNQLEKKGGDAEKATVKLRKSVDVMGKAFAAAAVVGVGSLLLLTKETLTYAKEVENLSRLSNLTTDEFQRYAAGAQLLGIEQEKLSDIFKDTNDKIGDFLQTGGGPLVDFFDNIAPKVGVTAEQFRDLSGPKALELYVTSLQKANVSQNEMTFFLEAIASDATALAPLLRDNGEGFKFLGEQAARSGAIMGKETLDAAKNLNASLYITGQTALGFKNTLVGELLPTLADLSISFNDVSTDGAIAAGVGTFIADSMRAVAKIAVGTTATFDLLGKAIGGYSLIAKEVLTFGDISGVSAIVNRDLKETALEYAQFLENIDDAGNANNIPESIEQIKSLFKASEELSKGLTGGKGSPTDALPSIEKYKELISVSERYNVSLRTPLEIYNDEIKLLEELKNTRRDGSNEALLSNENFARGSAEAYDKFALSLEKTKEELKDLNTETSEGEKLISNLQSASERWGESFADALVEGGSDFESFANGILKQLQKIALEKAFAPVFGEFAGLLGTLGNGLFSAGTPAFTGSGANSPMFANVGPSFDGGGSTGSGSRSGGIDGRGGFNAVLHPNETVIDHTKGQSMGGSTSVVVNVDASGSSTQGDGDGRDLGNLIGIAVRSVLIEESRPGGMLA
jgi:hypothetical protein